MIIAVIGNSQPSARVAELAEQVGRELARRGAMVVCGGLGGVMEAVCRGAKAEGGTTIGILPGSNPQDANPYVDIPICTGMGYARNIIVIKSGWAVIAVGGAFGTLSEIGHALGEDIPVIGIETWNLARNGQEDHSILRTLDPAEAVEKALEVARRRQQEAAHPGRAQEAP